jgi:hypothetical protein
MVGHPTHASLEMLDTGNTGIIHAQVVVVHSVSHQLIVMIVIMKTIMQFAMETSYVKGIAAVQVGHVRHPGPHVILVTIMTGYLMITHGEIIQLVIQSLAQIMITVIL